MLASSPAVSRKVFQHLPMSVGFRRGLPCLLSTIMLVAVIQGCAIIGPTCGGVISLESMCSPQCDATNLRCDKNGPRKELNLCTRPSVFLPDADGKTSPFKIATNCEERLERVREQCFTYFICNVCRDFCASEALWSTCRQRGKQNEEVVAFWIKQKNDGRCPNPDGCEAGTLRCYPKEDWDKCFGNSNNVSSSTTEPRMSSVGPKQTSGASLTNKTNDKTTNFSLPMTPRTQSVKAEPIRTTRMTPTSGSTGGSFDTVPVFPTVVAIGASAGAVLLLFVVMVTCLCFRVHRGRTQRNMQNAGHMRSRTAEEPVYYSADTEDHGPFPRNLDNTANIQQEPENYRTVNDVSLPDLEPAYSEIHRPYPNNIYYSLDAAFTSHKIPNI